MHEERFALIRQWFESWDDVQRIRCLDALLEKCPINLLQYVKYEATKRLRNVPPGALQQIFDSRQDFTRVIPRFLSLKVFSYLDPRSLCRCAQVSWYWKYLSDFEEIWQIKCAKLNWFPDENHLDTSSWKRCYQLNLLKLRYRSTTDVEEPTGQLVTTEHDEDEITNNKTDEDAKSTATTEKRKMVVKATRNSRSRENNKSPTKTKEPTVKPWRSSTIHPEDMYFNKFDKILKQKKAQRRAQSTSTKSKALSASSSKTNLTDYNDWIESHDNPPNVGGVSVIRHEARNGKDYPLITEHRRNDKDYPVMPEYRNDQDYKVTSDYRNVKECRIIRNPEDSNEMEKYDIADNDFDDKNIYSISKTKSTIVRELYDKPVNNVTQYETTDTLSLLHQKHNPWRYADALDDDY